MRRLAAKYGRPLAQNSSFWKLMKRFYGHTRWFYRRVRTLRELDQEEFSNYEQKRDKLYAEQTVLTGPFRGLKYTDLRTKGGAMWPKLLGSYEAEIHGVVEEICSQDYSAVVDIGCSEGYYAVGFGRRLPKARIFGYDTEPSALERCHSLATANGVTVETGNFCSAKTLRSIDLGARALIMADCEGYEKTLFTADLVADLHQHDFLIECHNMGDFSITESLRKAFAATHQLQEFSAIDELNRVYEFDYAELANFNIYERLRLMTEHRSEGIRWIYAVSKDSA